MKCPGCDTSNRRGARFCRQCNTALGVACTGCGKWSAIDGRFCDSCGTQLPRSAPIAEQSTRRKGGRSSPTAALGKRVLEGENKQVSVLFCDMVNSTDLTERLGHEAMHALLDRFFDLIVPEVTRLEGSVNQFLGDGFMALYGAPIAHEDHARRALLTALAIRQRLASKISIDGVGDFEVVVRMGINTGFVVVGRIGENLQMDYTAVGDTIVVAVRLQQSAGRGEILIGEATKRAVEGLVQLEALGSMVLKGRSQSANAYRVLDLNRRFGGEVMQRSLSPFVGREQEVAALHGALAEVESGRGRIIGLVGEPGIGKTRMLHELANGIAPSRATYLEGRCSPYQAKTAYSLVQSLLRTICGVAGTDSTAEIATKVSTTLEQLELDAGTNGPLLAQLLDPGTDLSSGGAAAETFKTRLFDVLSQILLRSSRRRPLVLGLENLHWVDPASSDFLTVLSERLAGAPVLVVGTYRPGYMPVWGTKSFASQVALRPLAASQAIALIAPILNDGQESLAASLIAKAEGNPFFLEELARNARERGDRSETAVPNSVHDVITARIDRLGADAKRVLQAASVLGREFQAETLARMLEPKLQLTRLLDELVRSEFLLERVELRGTTHVFCHALTQDVAYSMLLQGQRTRYHAAAGAAIEHAYRDRPASAAEQLAHHFGLSDRDEAAIKYGFMAADIAQRSWANETALGYFKSVAARLEKLPDTAANRLQKIDAVIRQAEVMFALGRQSEHVQALEAIRPLVEQCADDARRAEWSYWTGFLHSFTGSRPEVTIGYCREATRIAEQAGLEELQAYANCCLAHVLVLSGDLNEALAAGRKALPAFEKRGNVHWACRTLWGMSMAANAIGDWSASLEFCGRALEYGKKAEDNRLIVVGWMRTGSTMIFQGHPQQGIACCDEALSRSPSPYDVRMIRSIRAYGGLRTGDDPDLAVAELAEATAWFEQSNLQYTWTYLSLWLAEGYLRQDKQEAARSLAERAVSAATSHGYRHLEGAAQRLIGESLLSSDRAGATEHLTVAAQLAASVGARNDLARTRVLLASLQPERSQSLLMEALQDFKTLGTIDEITQTERLILRAAVA